MATVAENSVSVSAALLQQAKRYAIEEGRPVEALLEEALALYMEVEPRFHMTARMHRQRATEMGLTLDDYVMRVVKESRAEERERQQTA